MSREEEYCLWFVAHPMRCEEMRGHRIFWVLGCTWKAASKYFEHIPINYN